MWREGEFELPASVAFRVDEVGQGGVCFVAEEGEGELCARVDGCGPFEQCGELDGGPASVREAERSLWFHACGQDEVGELRAVPVRFVWQEGEADGERDVVVRVG